MVWNRCALFPSGLSLIFGCASCASAPQAPTNGPLDCPKASGAASQIDPVVTRLDLEADDSGWSLRGAERVSDQAHSGKSSISLRHSEGEFAMTKYELDISPLRGRRLHVAAWVKTEDVKDGWAGLWVRADRGEEHPYFENMETSGLTGSHDWTRLELVGDIPWDVDRVVIGALLPGKGRMWVDDFEVTTSLFGEPIAVTGQVKDHTGKGVPGARITFHANASTQHTVTDAQGRYGLELPLGSYAATVVPQGKPAQFLAEQLIQTPRALDFTLPTQGGFHFSGQLRGASAPAALACHLDVGRVSPVFTILPDSTGAFDAALPQGVYYCLASAGAAHSKALIVDREHELRHDFDLVVPTPTPDAVVSWFRERSLPLLSTEAGHGDGDLMPMKAAIGDARVVALGEATHGTREFSQLKHRMLEFLVSRMGFTVFAVEANWPETDQLNDYVLNGTGDPRAGLTAIKFWLWNTEEVLELVEWMRSWNANPKHERKLSFYGVDMQFTESAGEKLLAYLEQVAPELARSEAQPLQRFIQGLDTTESADHAMRRKSVEVIAHALDTQREAYEAKAGKRPWLFARRYATLLLQYLESKPPGKLDHKVRDRSMAENLKWVINQAEPGAKAVFWAHNAHIQESKDLVPSAGSYLAESLGKRYFSIGFVFGRGGFQAIDFTGSRRGLAGFEVGEPPSGSVDELLIRAGWPVSFVDLRQHPTSGAVGDWFQEDHTMREIGAVFESDEAMRQEVQLSERFDAVLFVATTNRSRPLPRLAAPQK